MALVSVGEGVGGMVKEGEGKFVVEMVGMLSVSTILLFCQKIRMKMLLMFRRIMVPIWGLLWGSSLLKKFQ